MGLRAMGNRVLLCLCLTLVCAHGFAEEKRPNILFAIADDWGVHGGAYGTTWVKTPTMDRVARDGLLFKNAFTPIAKCAPSRACILTGRYPWQLEDAANHQCFFSRKVQELARSFDGSRLVRWNDWQRLGARSCE